MMIGGGKEMRLKKETETEAESDTYRSDVSMSGSVFRLAAYQFEVEDRLKRSLLG
jgi:hypothetical protein